MLSVHSPEHFMKQAIIEAEKALEMDEVPVGAVIVCENKIIARAHNQTQMLNDVTAHAEMLAITAASNYLGGKYLQDCDVFVTLEPCLMCAGALSWAQIRTLYYACEDEKKGFTQYVHSNIFHSKTFINKGIMKKESQNILQTFFKQLRNK